MVKLPAIAILAAGLSIGGINIPQAWYWWKGDDTYHHGEYDQAAESYGKALATEAESGQSQVAMNQGNAQYRQEQYAEAEASFTQAFEADPHHWQALHNQGNARFYQDDLEGALESYEQALAIEEDEDTRHNYEYVKKLLEEQKKEDEEQQKENPQQQEDGKQPEENDEQGGDENEQQQESESEQGEQGEENDEQQEGENESESANDQGDKEKEQQGGEQEQDQGGDQEQQSGQGGNQQNRNDQGQLPDYGYSQQVLDQLAKEEAYYQQYQAQQRSPEEGDAMRDLLEEMLGFDGNLFSPGAADRRRDDDDGVDW